MKLLPASEVQKWDQFTIDNQNILSKELMHRASSMFTNWLLTHYLSGNESIAIVAGPGNNGGDGFCVAGILADLNYQVTVFHAFTKKLSEDCLYYKNAFSGKIIDCFEKEDDFINFQTFDIIIDAIFGSGLHSEVRPPYVNLIEKINATDILTISIDIPSGMFPDARITTNSVKADDCLSFEIPKIAFFKCFNSKYLQKWSYKSIGLAPSFLKNIQSNQYFIDSEGIKGLLKKRKPCSHKGTYGKTILVGGKKGMAGSIVLAAKSAYQTGAGLVQVISDEDNRIITQISIPEAIYESWDDFSNQEFSANAIGIGPGMGINKKLLSELLFQSIKRKIPIVIDADGLNTVSEYKTLHTLPNRAILTPHPKEFARLVGKFTEENMHNVQVETSKKYNLFIVLKGRYTSISNPEGDIFYNATGNPGMAKAGSGDVLTGMITGFLAQGYSELISCQLAVFLHGLAGDIAVQKKSIESISATDIINHISMAFTKVKSNE